MLPDSLVEPLRDPLESHEESLDKTFQSSLALLDPDHINRYKKSKKLKTRQQNFLLHLLLTLEQPR